MKSKTSPSNVGAAISVRGGKAQRAAYRALAGELELAPAQFEELETFARFGARLDKDTRKIIQHGRRIRACLKQVEQETQKQPKPEAKAELKSRSKPDETQDEPKPKAAPKERS